MARFPQTEPEVAALAARIIQGLTTASADFPAPPVPPADLQAQLDQYNQILGAIMVAETALREQHAAKDVIYEKMQTSMRADLKYSELTAREQPEKLNNIGWGARRDGVPVDLPGEVRDIQIRSEGDTWILFEWKAPVDGGAVTAYTIQRRKRDGGEWEDVGTAVGTQQLVSNQPRGIQFEYRVVAVNKAGAGVSSRTVAAVL